MQLLILLMETVQTTPWSENCLKKKWQKSLLSDGGWNTAGNTLGFALGQGFSVKKYADTADLQSLLEIRYLDDWAYTRADVQ